MRKANIAVALFVLMIAGCKSKEQRQADLSSQYEAANALYQKDCSVEPSDQDANAIVGAALGGKPSPEQQAAINQRQHEAEVRKNSPHCKELDDKRNDLTKQMLMPQNQ
jgi:hypothetical protein